MSLLCCIWLDTVNLIPYEFSGLWRSVSLSLLLKIIFYFCWMICAVTRTEYVTGKQSFNDSETKQNSKKEKIGRWK